MGDTVWMYIHQGPEAYARLSAAMILLATMILVGLRWRYRNGDIGADPAAAFPSTSTEAAFLITAFLASFTPTVFMTHVSEIYASAIVVPLALIVGRSAEGWSRLPKPLFISLVVAFGLHVAWASASIQSKVASLRDIGDRATVQLKQLLRWIPPETQEQQIAVVFLEQEVLFDRPYSVFRAGDDGLLWEQYAVEWYRPGRGHLLKHLVVQERSKVNEEAFDLVLHWNPGSREFDRWK